jgi:DNA-binding LytR/AlgR family response regulator
VSCHRSTLLNVAHCKAWRHALKEAIALVNLGGERVEEFIVSRTRKETFLQRWEEYFCKKRLQK